MAAPLPRCAASIWRPGLLRLRRRRWACSSRAPHFKKTGRGADPTMAAAREGSMQALAFDAYGTLFDVFSVTSLCEQMFPGKGMALATMWRAKQLQYTLLRSMMNRYKDFWQLTQDGLVYAAHALQLELDANRRKPLMDAYMTLEAFPDGKPGLQQLKAMGLLLAVLSNGEPKMLESAARFAGIADLLDA